MKPTQLLRREYQQAITSVMLPSTSMSRYNTVREFMIELELIPFTEILLIEFDEDEKLKNK